MNYCTQTPNARFFSSIDEIPETIWHSLACEKNIYFNRYFLAAIEKNHSEIQFSYIVLVDKKQQPTAFASIQLVPFFMDTLKENFNFLKSIGRKLHILKDKKPLRLFICGNTFVSGEHGIFIKQNQNKKQIVRALAKAILHFVKSDKQLKKHIDAFLLKDFADQSLFITSELEDFNYHPFSVEPNMLLTIDKNWQNFDDYLAAMKTKFRVKAKKAFKLSANIVIKKVTHQNIKDQIPKMTTLYQKVAENSNFNLGNFKLETYLDFKKNLGENYIVKTYWLEGKMVGFMSGVITKDSLDAHFVGIDYQLNREYAIYQKMLYDYVEIAISKKIKTINFGRTASEIKSSIGATPENLTMYFKHKKRLTNKILKLFLQRIEPTPFQQKFPFKK
ncbi:MAG: GNAT family N-acetyltransferase [Polaribacter sp.]